MISFPKRRRRPQSRRLMMTTARSRRRKRRKRRRTNARNTSEERLFPSSSHFNEIYYVCNTFIHKRVTNAQTISDVFCVHSLRLATKNTAKKQPPKQECTPGIRTMKKEMTCFIIRCFLNKKKKFTKKNETLSLFDQFFYASCIFCSRIST